MALTPFQRTIYGLIAANRLQQGESYVAGGAALNTLVGGGRISRDIDLFHDTTEALEATWQADRNLLTESGYQLRSIRERPSYVEAIVARSDESVLVQWARDSAFRFFPLVQHDEFGLVLHPFDLATNKMLALVGRLEIRDWIDLITCHDRIQPLAYLAWAACAKDPGFSPFTILEHAGRTGRYSTAEMSELSFDGPGPDLAALSRKWHSMLKDATETISLLPAEHVGKCVLNRSGGLYTGKCDRFVKDLQENELLFHPGSIRGAYPTIAGCRPD
jgi:hypothetical protein